ncbi:MAG: hypothetical protein FVQ85_16090 [Planctomycetes bacterium]|nr:hypothetical protein [Planctomycetota bacterium]
MSGTRISSLLDKITILVIICCFSISTPAKYGGGMGEPNDPYLIRDANHMQAIGENANDWDKHFKLMADIDLSCYDGQDGYGESLTDAEMKQQASFIDWDFVHTWNIAENQIYPYLRTVSPGDINKDRITNFLDMSILCNQWLKES